MTTPLTGDQQRMLARLYRAGENGWTARSFSDRVLVGELELHNLADWVDGRVYLITELGRQAWMHTRRRSTGNASLEMSKKRI